MDEIDFPEAPESLHLSDYDSDDTYKENIQKNDLQSVSRFPLQIEVPKQTLTETDLDDFALLPIEKKVLVNELSDYDMYLKNIHKGFAFVGSTNSLIKLVMAGVGVHKRRREVLKELKGAPKNRTLELDENGELS